MERFSVSSAYHLIMKSSSLQTASKWTRLRKIDIIERIKAFGWQLLHNRLLTNSRKARWGLGSAFCSHCRFFEETSLHVLRDCPLVVPILRHLVQPLHWRVFFSFTLDDWIEFNLHEAFGQHLNLDWTAVWITTCSTLWQWRNQQTHNLQFVAPCRPWERIVKFLNSYEVAKKSSWVVEAKCYIWKEVRWKPPAVGWITLNCDGAARATDGPSGCGGILRDSDGRWIGGYPHEAWGAVPLLLRSYGESMKDLCNTPFSRVTAFRNQPSNAKLKSFF